VDLRDVARQEAQIHRDDSGSGNESKPTARAMTAVLAAPGFRSRLTQGIPNNTPSGIAGPPAAFNILSDQAARFQGDRFWDQRLSQSNRMFGSDPLGRLRNGVRGGIVQSSDAVAIARNAVGR